MKVLIVANMYPERNPNFEYAGIFVKEQFEELSKLKGYNCSLFVIDGYKSKVNYIFESIKLLLHLYRNKYDIIHVHYGLSALFILLNPFKKKWENIVLTLHGGDILKEQGKLIQVFLTKLILNRVGKVLTLNDEMNNVVSEYRDDYTTFPCGVDASFFTQSNSVLKENVIIFPGNIDRKVKNYPLFISIINSYISKYGYIKVVQLDGYSRDEVKSHMQKAKAVLMTSISEGSPQVIKEAMSCDLAIISSDVGDVSFLIGKVKGTAIYNSRTDPSIIADLLHKTIGDSLDNIGDRRQRIIDLELDNKKVIMKLTNIYNEVLFNVK